MPSLGSAIDDDEEEVISEETIKFSIVLMQLFLTFPLGHNPGGCEESRILCSRCGMNACQFKTICCIVVDNAWSSYR